MGVGLSDILGGIFSPIKDIVSEVVVDKDKRDQINLELAKIEDQAQARLDALQVGQIETNKIEAASGSLFVAGWRPFVGWVGGVALAYSSILQPLLNWGSRVAGYTGALPELNDTLLMTIMTGMLGIGVQRTYEKVKGVATEGVTPKQDAPATTVQVKPSGEVNVEQPVKKKHFHIF